MTGDILAASGMVAFGAFVISAHAAWVQRQFVRLAGESKAPERKDVPDVKWRPPTCPRCPYAGVRGNFCPRCGWQFACNYDVRVWLEGRREVLRLQKEVAEAAAAAAAPALELARETMMWIPADGGPPCFIDVAKERAAERIALSNGMLPPHRRVEVSASARSPPAAPRGGTS